MTEAEGDTDAERLFLEASAAEDAGRADEAIALYRQAARLGQSDAQSNLGVELTNLGGAHRVEGIRWLKRSARSGNPVAAWNLAMEHRLGGSRRAYLYWMRAAANLGHDEAIPILAEIEGRRARREPWFMLMASVIDAWDVEWILGEVRDEAQNAAQAATWANDVILRRRAIGIASEESTRLLPVLWEIARGGLTPQRARELLMKLAR